MSLCWKTFVVDTSAASRALITVKGKGPYPNGVSGTKDLDSSRRSSELQSLYGSARERDILFHYKGKV